VHHGELILKSFVSEPRSGGHSNANAEPNLLGHIDTIGMLNDIFGYIRKDAFKMTTIIIHLTLEIL